MSGEAPGFWAQWTREISYVPLDSAPKCYRKLTDRALIEECCTSGLLHLSRRIVSNWMRTNLSM
jgi:hypothetical protein